MVLCGARLFFQAPNVQITTFLMFTGAAEEAMSFYVSQFPGSRIVEITRYGEGEAGRPGTVMRAVCEVGGLRLMCIDSPVEHAFGFTPAISLFVDGLGPGDVDRLASSLGAQGAVLMPPGGYGFSARFAWVQDRFGVTWQLNQP